MNKKSQGAFALIKLFSHEEHYLSFKSGVSLFRTPHYYRLCESVGRGDRSESCLFFWDKDLSCEYKPSILDSRGKSVDYSKLSQVFVYPVGEQFDAWMQSWAIVGPHNNFEHSLERLKDEFGSYFVMLPASKIKLYARLIERKSGYKVRHGMVGYSANRLDYSLTVKDIDFSYQKEYRFFAGTCSKDEVESKFFNLSGLNKLLLNCMSLKITSPNGDVRWCSVGHEGIVAVEAKK